MFVPAKDMPEFITRFIVESNAIEGIYRPPSKTEISVALKFLALDRLTLADIKKYVTTYQKDAVLRDKIGLNVMVGSHLPPKGGPEIKKALMCLLREINAKDSTPGANPYEAHNLYETLHPFTDCNGRSGRIIWLWQMLKLKKNFAPLGFMQTWYYNSLSDSRKV